MTSSTMPETLHRLVRRLDAALTAPVETLGNAVTAALGEAVVSNDWLNAEQQRASHDHYTRHILYADPQNWYPVVAIAWGSGHRSPIHGPHTWCGVAISSGEVNETFYEIDSHGSAQRPTRTVRRTAGTLSFDADLAGAHRIVNDAQDVAISIHVYGVGAARIATDVNRIVG